MNNQIEDLLNQIDHDAARLMTLEVEISAKQLQVESVKTAITAKRLMVDALRSSAAKEANRAERRAQFPIVEFKPLRIGTVRLEDEAARPTSRHDWNEEFAD